MIFKKTLYNTIFLLIGGLIFRFANAALIVMVGRYLGVEYYGKFEIAMSFANLFLIFFDLGMGTLLIRESTRDNKKLALLFGNTLLVEAFMSILLFVSMLTIAFFIVGYEPTVQMLIVILGSGLLIFEYRRAFRSVFRVQLRMNIPAIFEIIVGIALVSAVAYITHFIVDKNDGLKIIAWSYFWIQILSIVGYLLYTLKTVKPKWDLKKIPSMLRQSYIFSMSAVFFTMYFQVDQVLLSILKNSREVGLYAASAKFIVFLVFIPQMTYEAVLPVLYKFDHEKSEKLNRAYAVMTRYLSAIGFPAAVIMFLLSKELILFLFGKAFLPASQTLQIFSWFVVMRFLSTASANILTALDKQKQRVKIEIFVLALNVIGDLILIPHFGFVGPAIATITCESILAILYISMAKKYSSTKLKDIFAKLINLIFACVIIGIIILILKPFLHVAIICAIAGLIYIPLLYAVGFFTEHDKKLLNQFRKKQPENI